MPLSPKSCAEWRTLGPLYTGPRTRVHMAVPLPLDRVRTLFMVLCPMSLDACVCMVSRYCSIHFCLLGAAVSSSSQMLHDPDLTHEPDLTHDPDLIHDPDPGLDPLAAQHALIR